MEELIESGTHTTTAKTVKDDRLPEGWMVKELADLGTFSKGKGIAKSQLSPTGLPCVRYGEIYTKHDFVIREFQSFIDDNVAKESTKIKKGDILFAGSGEKIEDIGKAAAYLGDEEAYAGGDTIILSCDEPESALCISYALELDAVKRQKRRLGQGHSVVHIYPRDLSQVKLPLPPLPEQQAIAACLGKWDAAMERQQKLIDAKEARKKWLMQVLLTGKKRLPGFDEKWKVRSLNELLKATSRPIDKPTDTYLALGIRSHGKGTFLKEDADPEKNAMDILYEVRTDDLIVNITFAWEGAIAIIKPEDDGALVSHRFPTYVMKQGMADVSFMRFLIVQPRMTYLLGQISPGGAGRNRVMKKSDFLTLEFKVPDYDEQVAIGKVLLSADRELVLLRGQLDGLREQKKGLMQMLLTGRKRLL